MFGPLIAKPGSSQHNKTGSWRIKSRPKFLKKECIGCKLCILVCPESCITGSDKDTINCDLDYCKGCGLCVKICPKKDIIMEEER